MKKEYLSPKFDYSKLNFLNLLNDVDVSKGEHGSKTDDDTGTGEL